MAFAPVDIAASCQMPTNWSLPGNKKMGEIDRLRNAAMLEALIKHTVQEAAAGQIGAR